MSEHLSGQAIGQTCTSWCHSCRRFTIHRVDRVAVGSHAGKPGPCLDPGHAPKPEVTKQQQRRRIEQRRREMNPLLFGHHL